MKASSAAFPHSRATIFAAKAKATYQPSRDCQSSSSSRSAQAYSVQIIWLAKPPQQLSHSIPELFLLCDSGATHHLFNHRMFFANIRDTVKDCPVCAVMKCNRPKKPASLHVEEMRQWKLWEKEFSDSSGKTRVKSFQGNRYYSVRSGCKLFFAHKKKSHHPLEYFKFCARVGRYPKLLVTDQADEILSKAMGSRLAAQGTRIDPCPKDEHSKISSAERAIGELDRMIACSVLDGNLPPASWDLVGDQKYVLNAATQSCPTDDSITIYEAETE